MSAAIKYQTFSLFLQKRKGGWSPECLLAPSNGNQIPADNDIPAAVAFVRLLHQSSDGYRLLTSQQPRQNGSIARPFHQFFLGRDYLNAVSSISGRQGYFYSFSTFMGSGRADTASLEHLTALYQDLDWHNSPEANRRFKNVDEVIQEVDRRCDTWGFPRPNLVIHSGRGCQVAWLHQPIFAAESKNLDTWNTVQTYICGLLKDLGSDPRAKPAVHFFKLPGQINPKSGRVVSVIRQPENGLRFQFEDLVSSLFPSGMISATADEKKPRNPTLKDNPPKTERKVIDLGVRRAIRMGRPSAIERAPGGQGATGDATAAIVWYPRLKALQTILEHRAAMYGGLPEGHRDGILFVTAVALSWITPTHWKTEYLSMVRDHCPAWTEREALDRASAVAKRAGLTAEGDGEFRYLMKSETIREFAEITFDEERLPDASAIARKSIQHQQHIARERESRREHGRKDRERVTGLDRQGYQDARAAAATERTTKAREMKKQGIKIRIIAERLGCSVAMVNVYLKENETRKMYNGGRRCMLSSFFSSPPVAQQENQEREVGQPTHEPSTVQLAVSQLEAIASAAHKRGATAPQGELPDFGSLESHPVVREAKNRAYWAILSCRQRMENRMKRQEAEIRKAALIERIQNDREAAENRHLYEVERLKVNFLIKLEDASLRPENRHQIEEKMRWALSAKWRTWHSALRVVKQDHRELQAVA